MEEIKKTKEYTIYKKRNGRYGVRNSKGQWVHAESKTEILNKEGLIKVAVARPQDSSSDSQASE